MTRYDVLKYVKDKYGTEPDFPWGEFSDYAVIRHKNNNKWYGLLAKIPKNKLGLDGNSKVDILNIKCNTIMISSLINHKDIISAYHMNKNHWITIILENFSSPDKLYDLIDLSYDLTLGKKKI